MESLSLKARAFILGVILVGGGLLSWELAAALAGLGWRTGLVVAVTAVVAALAQVLKVEGATQKSSYNISLLLYGFAFLAYGPAAGMAVMLFACLVEWAWYRYPWFIQSFNIGGLAIALYIAGAVQEAVMLAKTPGNLEVMVGILAAGAAFVGFNHLLVGMVLWVARGENFAESGVFGRLTLLIDSTLFWMGAVAALVWQVNPFSVFFTAIPLYLIYTTLKVPALERQAVTDPKTGLFNAKYFSETLQRELERAARFGHPLTVIVGDLDLLRRINNTYGHLAGDVVLEGVAAILKSSVRDYDIVCRWGGEEFAILMPETSIEQALPRVEALRKTIEEASFEVATSVEPIGATMSFGVAGRTDEITAASELIHEADLAVYRAKLEGRNRFCLADNSAGLVVGSERPAGDPVSVPDDGQMDPASEYAVAFRTAPTDGLGVGAYSGVDGEPEPEAQARACAPAADCGSEVVEDEEAAAAPGSSRGAWISDVYVATLAVLALTVLWFTVRPPFEVDVAGLLLFVGIAFLTESLAIDIYVRDTSVSTSAAPVVAGVLLFGPLGAVVLSVAVSAAAWIKHRSALNRFVFNSSVHFLAGLTSAWMVSVAREVVGGRPPWLSATLGLLCAGVFFVFTSVFVAGAISLSTGQPPRRVWRERFSWIAPYYLGFGLVAAALVFGFRYAGAAGVAAVLVPLLMLRTGQKQYISRTQSIVAQLRRSNDKLARKAREIESLNEELLQVLSNAVDLRDPNVLGHSQQVARYAVLIAEELGLEPGRVETVRKAGLLHDVGKLGIPESILLKPGRLTNAEYKVVQQHCDLGVRILEGCSAMDNVVEFIRSHHERYDGKGYPRGINGQDIPLEARILSLADAVEAMASDRPYRAGSDPETVLRETLVHSGTQFDPTVVAAFHRVLEREGPGVICNSAVRDGESPEEAVQTAASGGGGPEAVVELDRYRRSPVTT